MKVFRVFRIVDAVLIVDVALPEKAENSMGKFVGLLSGLRWLTSDIGPDWSYELELTEGAKIPIQFGPVLAASEYERSQVQPVCFSELRSIQEAYFANDDPGKFALEYRAVAKWLWLFRDGIYSTDKPPQMYEPEEVILRIKSLHFQRDERLRRLREQVANFEAIETNLGKEKTRRPLPDDVKLLVWSRDGGACVKCGSQSELHFDHIIAFARGGSDEAENIQLLCRSCNLAKSDRLT